MVSRLKAAHPQIQEAKQILRKNMRKMKSNHTIKKLLKSSEQKGKKAGLRGDDKSPVESCRD